MIHYSEVEERLFALLKENDHESRRIKALQLWQDVYIHRMQPVAIDNRALFLFYGEAQAVTLVGDWSFWQPNTSLKRIDHTDLFYAIVQFPKDARMQYKMIVDGNWMNDPANARVQAEGFGYNSEFWMPSYKDVSKLDIGREVPHGKVERVMYESSLLNSHREMFLYTPPKRNPTTDGVEEEYPLIIVHDGAEALRLGNFHRIMDNCIAEGLIPPVLALFISPQWRNEEYATNEKYITFTAEEALPFAIEQFAKRGFNVTNDRMLRCVTGASLGGLLSTKTVLRYPDAFGSVLSQSPSYWWNRGEVFRSPYLRNAHRIHFIIQTGTICDAKDLASRMANSLRSIGTRVDYYEYSQGHTWGNWRTTFAEGIQAWLPNVPKEHAVT
ncbi:MAG: hypothetical protein JNL32_14160 [Candidatus Kapabacteria bacterium]|nr:hypothetical protein [Candidatus Kapabacteria bacterium]